MFFKKKINIILFLFLILTICFLYLLTFERKNINSENIDSLIKSKFNLTTHLGQKVNEEYFYGNHMLVYFGFTFCPDVCPNSLNKILETVNQLPVELQNKINVVFITVDPERDNVEIMREYVSHFDKKLIGLTGTKKQISEAAKSFRIYYKKIIDNSSEYYQVDHSTIIYVFDKKGQFVKHFSHDIKIVDLKNNLKSILLSK